MNFFILLKKFAAIFKVKEFAFFFTCLKNNFFLYLIIKFSNIYAPFFKLWIFDKKFSFCFVFFFIFILSLIFSPFFFKKNNLIIFDSKSSSS